MVASLAHRLAPRAAARTHLLLAALMWSLVGAVLATVGGRWGWDPRITSVVLLAAAATVGVVKSRLVLDRAARRIASRITARGDDRCVGGFLSARSWLLVGAMAGVGRVLRSGVVSRHLVGLLYVAVGTGLVLSSRLLWRSYLESAG